MHLTDFYRPALMDCVVDSDCRLSALPDYNSYFCIESACQRIQGAGGHCIRPQDCASYSYYGPLACSAACRSQSECSSGITETTAFCCRAIPLKGECSAERPGVLSGCSASNVCAMDSSGGTCSESKEKSWLLGTICSITGNALINIGVNFQKKSYAQSHLLLARVSVNTLALGSVVYALGKIISFISYVFGNQSLIAGLSATGLLSNSLFAPLINGEVFTWKDAVAIVLVIIGTATIITNTSSSHVVYSLCELMKMYMRTGTVLWFSFIIAMIIVLFLAIKYVEVNSDWEMENDYFGFMRRDVFFDSDGIMCNYVMVFLYVFLSSFIASFTTLSAKSLGEIIDRIVGGDNLFTSKATYFFSASLVGCTLLQIYWLNRALKHYDALLVVPIFHISWTLLSILTAGIYFQDFDHYSTSQFRNFIIGVMIIFSGSMFLGFRIVSKNTVNSREIDVPEELSRKDD